jgi:hypothetical protein
MTGFTRLNVIRQPHWQRCASTVIRHTCSDLALE